jgi:hypothetical protein
MSLRECIERLHAAAIHASDITDLRVARRRLMETISQGPMRDSARAATGSTSAEAATEDSPFTEALPLLYRILGIAGIGGQP